MSRPVYDTKIKGLNLRIIDSGNHNIKLLKKEEDFFRREINRPEHLFFEMGLEANPFYQGLTKLLENKDKIIHVPDSLYKGFTLNDTVISVIGIDIFSRSLGKPVSRKDFIKRSAMGLAGLYLTTSYKGIREDILQLILRKDATLDNKISYDAIQDFRNIASAENIYRAVNELGFEGEASLFEGHSHFNGLRAYIDNPDMMKKRKLYPQLDSFWTYLIKEYKNIGGVWKLAGFI